MPVAYFIYLLETGNLMTFLWHMFVNWFNTIIFGKRANIILFYFLLKIIEFLIENKIVRSQITTYAFSILLLWNEILILFLQIIKIFQRSLNNFYYAQVSIRFSITILTILLSSIYNQYSFFTNSLLATENCSQIADMWVDCVRCLQMADFSIIIRRKEIPYTKCTKIIRSYKNNKTLNIKSREQFNITQLVY